MINDLISREALKKAIYEWRYHGYYDKLIEVIDNAPTVDWKFYYNHGYKQAERDLKRPQGEWIDNGTITSPVCNLCGFWCTDLRQKEWHFCPNCGADMKGGAK